MFNTKLLVEKGLESGVATSISISNFDLVNTYSISNGLLYDIASLTKVVFTLLVVKMQYLNLIDIETEISKFLKTDKHITIAQLLSHRSGLHDEDFTYFTLCELNSAQIHDEYKYADANFIILFYILKQFGSASKLLDDLILEPIGLKEKILFVTNKLKKENFVPTEIRDDRGLVQGVVHDSKCYKMQGYSCHAGLFCDVESFANLWRAVIRSEVMPLEYFIDILNKYSDGKRTIGFEVTNKQMDRFSGNSYFHTGFTGTSLLIDFNHLAGIVIFTNRVYPTRKNELIFEYRREVHSHFYDFIGG